MPLLQVPSCKLFVFKLITDSQECRQALVHGPSIQGIKVTASAFPAIWGLLTILVSVAFSMASPYLRNLVVRDRSI
jgi:hypothetical protein